MSKILENTEVPVVKDSIVNTDWKLYTENESSWNAMLEACRNAKESIVLEQFIFIRNNIGEQFIEICSKKASEGVKIRFLWDAAGSFSFTGSKSIDELKSLGIELVFFKTFVPGFYNVHDYKSWYLRNHRRTLVIDGKIGFTGSICVSDDMRDWRDTVVKLEGPVVNEMKSAFERMWYRAKKIKIPKRFEDGMIFNRSDYINKSKFKYITNNPLPGKRYLYNNLLQSISNAKEYIYITTPYFIPTRRLVHAIMNAVKNGVIIKILLPENTDHSIVDLCSRTFFNKLLKAGVRIYLYKGNEKEMIHSKTIIIDGKWSSIGTMNMDNISLLHNYEANIVSTDIDFAEELLTHFIDDIEKSKEIVFSDWKNRPITEKIETFFVRFLRDFL